jgi:hypothetical protein
MKTLFAVVVCGALVLGCGSETDVPRALRLASSPPSAGGVPADADLVVVANLEALTGSAGGSDAQRAAMMGDLRGAVERATGLAPGGATRLAVAAQLQSGAFVAWVQGGRPDGALRGERRKFGRVEGVLLDAGVWIAAGEDGVVLGNEAGFEWLGAAPADAARAELHDALVGEAGVSDAFVSVSVTGTALAKLAGDKLGVTVTGAAGSFGPAGLRAVVRSDDAGAANLESQLAGLRTTATDEIAQQAEIGRSSALISESVPAILTRYQGEQLLERLTFSRSGERVRVGMTLPAGADQNVMLMTTMAGVMAAIAVPAFNRYIERARAIEAPEPPPEIAP